MSHSWNVTGVSVFFPHCCYIQSACIWSDWDFCSFALTGSDMPSSGLFVSLSLQISQQTPFYFSHCVCVCMFCFSETTEHRRGPGFSLRWFLDLHFSSQARGQTPHSCSASLLVPPAHRICCSQQTDSHRPVSLLQTVLGSLSDFLTKKELSCLTKDNVYSC